MTLIQVIPTSTNPDFTLWVVLVLILLNFMLIFVFRRGAVIPKAIFGLLTLSIGAYSVFVDASLEIPFHPLLQIVLVISSVLVLMSAGLDGD